MAIGQDIEHCEDHCMAEIKAQTKEINDDDKAGYKWNTPSNVP